MSDNRCEGARDNRQQIELETNSGIKCIAFAEGINLMDLEDRLAQWKPSALSTTIALE
jgi:hypothetical protein